MFLKNSFGVEESSRVCFHIINSEVVVTFKAEMNPPEAERWEHGRNGEVEKGDFFFRCFQK